MLGHGKIVQNSSKKFLSGKVFKFFINSIYESIKGKDWMLASKPEYSSIFFYFYHVFRDEIVQQYISISACSKEKVMHFLKLENVKRLLKSHVSKPQPLNFHLIFFLNQQFKYCFKKFLPAIIHVNWGTMISSSGTCVSDFLITTYITAHHCQSAAWWVKPGKLL